MLKGYGAVILDGAWLTLQLALCSMALAIVLGGRGLYAIAKRMQPTIDAGTLFREHAEYAVAKAEGRI